MEYKKKKVLGLKKRVDDDIIDINQMHQQILMMNRKLELLQGIPGKNLKRKQDYSGILIMKTLYGNYLYDIYNRWRCRILDRKFKSK